MCKYITFIIRRPSDALNFGRMQTDDWQTDEVESLLSLLRLGL